MAMRYQPQGIWRLAQAYRPLIVGGWLAQAGASYASLGPAGLSPTARFSSISGVAVTPFGYALRSNSAADSLGNGSIIASLTIGAVPARRNFTFAGIFQVRGSEGAGVGARSSSTDIYFRRESGNYSVSVNSVKTVGPAMPLDTPLHYVLTSNNEGIFLSVNGVEVIAAARSTSTLVTGSPVEVYEDTLRGGAMDLDVGMCVLLNAGLGREAARNLSNNLWQVFAEPDDEDDFVPAAVSRVLQVERAGLVLGGGHVGMKVSRRLRVAPAALAIAGGSVSMQYSPSSRPGSYTLPVLAAAMQLGGGNVSMRVSRRLPVAPARLDLAGGAVRALVGRRMTVAPAAMALMAGGVGVRAARRTRVTTAQLVLVGGSVQLRYSSQIEYARAPAGSGYAPQRAAVSSRPAQTGGHRPPATQETTR